MTPEAARVLKSKVQFTNGKFTVDGKRIDIRTRYAGWYFESVARGCLYLVPASAFAWYWHYDEWPSLAVRHRNGNKLDFDKDNLRLTATAQCPKVRLVGRLGSPKVHDGVLRRTVKPDG